MTAPSSDLTAGRVSIPEGHSFHLWMRIAGGIGVVALIVSFLLKGDHGQRFYASYLVSFLFFLSLALGGLFFVLVQFASRAGWSVVVRRLAEHVMGTLPVFALLFIPVALGVHELFHWSHADAMAHDPILEAKKDFLNSGAFYFRAVIYLAAWGVLGWWFRKRSLAQDESRDPAITRRLQSLSAPALVVFAVTVTFASFDWIMTLEPHWFSTAFGVYFFSGCVIAIMALLIILATELEHVGVLGKTVTLEHFHDLGKLLFAFVVFWAYIGFSQYMLIWYANIPEETVWFADRLVPGWYGTTVFLAVGHFALPFLFLLSASVKRHHHTITMAAFWMLIVHYLDLYWMVMPTFDPGGFHPALLDLTTFLGIGGVFLAALGWNLRRPALVPVGDPRLPESLSFENM